MENQYSRAVRPDGNPASRKLIEEVFEVCDRKWRGIGLVPRSGFKLREVQGRLELGYHLVAAGREQEGLSILGAAMLQAEELGDLRRPAGHASSTADRGRPRTAAWEPVPDVR